MKLASTTRIYGFWSFRQWMKTLPVRKDPAYYEALYYSQFFKVCVWNRRDGFVFFDPNEKYYIWYDSIRS